MSVHKILNKLSLVKWISKGEMFFLFSFWGIVSFLLTSSKENVITPKIRVAVCWSTVKPTSFTYTNSRLFGTTFSTPHSTQHHSTTLSFSMLLLFKSFVLPSFWNPRPPFFFFFFFMITTKYLKIFSGIFSKTQPNT